MLCILNVGTVPTLCILYVGTVPMLCILNIGTVPTFSPSLLLKPKNVEVYRIFCSCGELHGTTGIDYVVGNKAAIWLIENHIQII